MFFKSILNSFVDIFRKIKDKKEKGDENVLISKIFFVRHGRSHYKEYLKGEKNVDLCPEGIKQIEKTACELSKKINKDLPVVLISSPRIRTRNTSKIIKEFLTFEGVEIASNKIVESEEFEAVRLDKENLRGASYRLVKNYHLWISGSYSNNFVEPHDSFFERIKSSFKEEIINIRCDKKFKQIILVSHGEVFDAFMLGFKLWTKYEQKNALENGGIVEIQVFQKKVVILFRNKEYVLDETKIKLNPLIK